MLKKNMDTKLICEVIGFTHDELNIIKKELNKRGSSKSSGELK